MAYTCRSRTSVIESCARRRAARKEQSTDERRRLARSHVATSEQSDARALSLIDKNITDARRRSSSRSAAGRQRAADAAVGIHLREYDRVGEQQGDELQVAAVPLSFLVHPMSVSAVTAKGNGA